MGASLGIPGIVDRIRLYVCSLPRPLNVEIASRVEPTSCLMIRSCYPTGAAAACLEPDGLVMIHSAIGISGSRILSSAAQAEVGGGVKSSHRKLEACYYKSRIVVVASILACLGALSFRLPGCDGVGEIEI